MHPETVSKTGKDTQVMESYNWVTYIIVPEPADMGPEVPIIG